MTVFIIGALVTTMVIINKKLRLQQQLSATVENGSTARRILLSSFRLAFLIGGVELIAVIRVDHPVGDAVIRIAHSTVRSLRGVLIFVTQVLGNPAVRRIYISAFRRFRE